MTEKTPESVIRELLTRIENGQEPSFALFVDNGTTMSGTLHGLNVSKAASMYEWFGEVLSESIYGKPKLLYPPRWLLKMRLALGNETRKFPNTRYWLGAACAMCAYLASANSGNWHIGAPLSILSAIFLLGVTLAP